MKNYYYRPWSDGSRGQMLEGFNFCYLFTLCYAIFLSVNLDTPMFYLPGWLTRYFVLKP